jgi:uncharacterized RDD family membrane protein YckC
VDLDDRITISTPEGLELALTLAGLGSRFIAGAADLTIQLVLIGILALIAGAIAGLATAVVIVLSFLTWFLYPILFEVLAAGRTPGKRWTHLRVMRDTGAPVDLQASAIRNLMRLVDGLLLLYLPTIISIVVTRRNQRPGDLAAGTIVIRENPLGERGRGRGTVDGRGRVSAPAPVMAPSVGPPAAGPGWDVSAVTPQEVAAVRQFLDRRETLDTSSRHALARRLAEGLSEKVSGAPPGLENEQFLEALTREKLSG